MLPLYINTNNNLKTTLTKVILDDISDSLRVRGGARPAAVDMVRDASQLVRYSVGDVRAGSCSRVGADHYAAVELTRHDRRTSAVWCTHPFWDAGV